MNAASSGSVRQRRDMFLPDQAGFHLSRGRFHAYTPSSITYGGESQLEDSPLATVDCSLVVEAFASREDQNVQ